MKVVADIKIPYLKGVLEPFFNINYLPADKITNESIRETDILLTRSRTNCNRKLLKGTRVKMIVTATIGFDHIDTAYCDANKIKWTNTPGCNSASVAQYISSVLLNLIRHNNLLFNETTLGIIGVGNIGSKVERIAKAFGMKVLLNDPPRARIEGDKDFVTLEQLAVESDIITLHVPLNYSGIDKTFHLVDDIFIKNIGKKPFLINSSRGDVVDGSVLKLALKSGCLSGAVLDVWENEPEIDEELFDLVIYGTPHIAGYSADGKANGTSMAVRTLNDEFKLGIDNWYPGTVPEPGNNILTVDCSNKSMEEILYDVIIKTYDIRKDHELLKNSLEDFEKLRAGHTFRREFTAYSVQLINDCNNYSEIVRKTGFNLKNYETNRYRPDRTRSHGRKSCFKH